MEEEWIPWHEFFPLPRYPPEGYTSEWITVGGVEYAQNHLLPCDPVEIDWNGQKVWVTVV